MPTQHEDFRPNPKRAIYLTGLIEQDTIDRLTPQIINLRFDSSRPITVFIDSPGGETRSAARLFRALKIPDLDQTFPCRIIAVATGMAASAAADIMLAADYAMAYPETSLLLHGVRVAPSSNDRLTREGAQALAIDLEAENENYGIRLARNCIDRFLLQYAMSFPKLSSLRGDKGLDPTASDIEVFATVIKERVSKNVREVVDRALERSRRSERLDRFVLPRVLEGTNQESFRNATPAQAQAMFLKAIIDFEVVENSGTKWDFIGSGLSKLTEDFLLLQDSVSASHDTAVSKLSSEWSQSFLSAEETHALGQIETDEDRRREESSLLEKHLRPAWFFFVSLCKLLQQGENFLTADDAYHLGLIDEIIGRPEMPSLRMFVEFAPEQASAVSGVNVSGEDDEGDSKPDSPP